MKENKKSYQYKIRLKYQRKQLGIILIILICFVTVFTIFGRYVTNNINNFFVRSKEFYFNSDKLKENQAVYQIDNWSGIDSYDIIINMDSRKNNLEAATYDIGYNISYTCSDNAICQLSKTNGIIKAKSNTDSFNLTITPNTQLEVGDKVEVEIQAESTAQYKKMLKGKFTLVVGKERLSYQITDSAQSPYIELRLTNTLSYYIVNQAFDAYTVGQKIDSDTYIALSDENKKKCYSTMVTMNFDPSKVLIDMTNNTFEKATNIETTTINGKTYINSVTINMEAISSENIRFYKVDVSKDYTYPNGNASSIITITSQ